MNFHQSFKKCRIHTPDIRKTTSKLKTTSKFKRQIKLQPFVASRGSCVHNYGKIFGGIPKIFMQFPDFPQNSDGFRQNDSHGYYNSKKQNPLEE